MTSEKAEFFSELKDLIDFLRENGVAHYKHTRGDSDMKDTIELLLVEPPPKHEQPQAKQPKDPLATVPRGKDGLTAEEQEELYGTVIDAKPSTE